MKLINQRESRDKWCLNNFRKEFSDYVPSTLTSNFNFNFYYLQEKKNVFKKN